MWNTTFVLNTHTGVPRAGEDISVDQSDSRRSGIPNENDPSPRPPTPQRMPRKTAGGSGRTPWSADLREGSTSRVVVRAIAIDFDSADSSMLPHMVRGGPMQRGPLVPDGHVALAPRPPAMK